MRRRFTAELSVRVEDLIASARTRFKILAALAFVELPALGWAIDWLLSGETGIGMFAVIGGVTGLLALLMILDWGRKLDARPRGMNLIKARNGALIMFMVLPLGPLIAWGLWKILRHPTLVKHAVANHPDAGRLEDEDVLALVRVRAAYITMRRAGFALAGAAILAAVAGGTMSTSDAEIEYRVRWFVTAVSIGIYAAGHVVNGFVGVALLKEMSVARVERLRKLAILIWGLFPIGTYAAWSSYQVDLDGLTGSAGAAGEEEKA